MVNPSNDDDMEKNVITDIADFLAKPMPVASGAFTTANNAGDNLFSNDLFTLFNSTSIWVSKIQGFLNMRGTVKLRLVINPTPFQAGLLKLSYFPCSNQLGNEMNAHLNNRMVISQLPGVYLNLCNNFVELSVPYVSPTSFIERDRVAAGDYVSWGSVFVHVFQPLRTGTGPTSINWTLWMSVEDLDLSGMVQPQMAKGKRISNEANGGKGPVTKIMSSGVQLLNDMSEIPVLAPLTKPASWVVDALRGLAENFGWSKPTISEGPCLSTINQNHFAVNGRGNDNCAPLSIDPDNRLATVSDAAPGEKDEMSFNFVKRQWSWFAHIQWTTASVAGTGISNITVSPNRFKLLSSVGGVACKSATPCSVFSELYSSYRGSFEIRLRIVKTGFHTGTLAVGFVPGKTAVTPSYNDSAYVYRQIIDIQDGSDFTFNLPYLIPQDFIENGAAIGNFFIYVVNPLVAPATVASTVDIQFEVRGGPDLMYTIPIGMTQTPFVPQGKDNDPEEVSTAIVLGSSNHVIKDLSHASSSIGEAQMSFLELLKASSVINYASATSTLSTGNNFAYMGVGKIYGTRYNGASLSSAEVGGDIISFVGSWYALWRGAQRFRIIPADPDSTGNNMRAMLVPYGTIGWSGGYGSTWVTANAPGSLDQDGVTSLLTSTNQILAPNAGYADRVYQTGPVNAGLAVQVPFYNRTRYALNHWAVNTGDTLMTFHPDNGVAFYVPGANKSTIARSLGDDFQFSYFVGIPTYTESFRFYNKYT